VAVTLAGFSGCGNGDKTAANDGKSAAHDHDHGQGHDHSALGPHDGHIIELGTESHHAELTHDDDENRVGVYILDGEAKGAAPIEAEFVVINTSVDGQPTEYVLPAVRSPEDAEEKSSYFELVSEPLTVIVSGRSDKPNTRARINVEIDGKPYVGIIETEHHDHNHDHSHGHDH
jgi:hypothetical protein